MAAPPPCGPSRPRPSRPRSGRRCWPPSTVRSSPIVRAVPPVPSARGRRPPRADAARRQRRTDEGDHDARHPTKTGGRARLQPALGEQRQPLLRGPVPHPQYTPAYPDGPFADLAAARAGVAIFVPWYNEQHRHSAIGFVTPGQRHRGEEVALLEQRWAVYEEAKARQPIRPAPFATGSRSDRCLSTLENPSVKGPPTNKRLSGVRTALIPGRGTTPRTHGG